MIKQALSFDDVLLTPQHSSLITRADVRLEPPSLCGFGSAHPILSSNMTTITEEKMARAMDQTGGFGVLHRMCSIEDQVKMIESLHDTDVISFSVGAKNDDIIRAIESFRAGGDVCFLDIAHADSEVGHAFVRNWYKDADLKNRPLVIGQLATPRAIQRYLDIIPKGSPVGFKIGIGGGSLCTTRIQTGSGLPTFQSILDCEFAYPNRDFCLIADGGIKNSGDIVKALAAGANYVMVGSVLAGTSETPGNVILKDNRWYKIYRGSASYADKTTRGEAGRNLEGVETLVEYRGSTIDVIERLLDGIRSGCSYNGVHSVNDLKVAAEFVQITPQGLSESGAHGA